MRKRETRIHIIIYVLAAILFCGKVSAMPHFEHFNTNERTVYAFYRDNDGILWMGTSRGLMTYAQLVSQMRVSFHYSEAMNNVITGIRQDNTGRLWLMTQSNRYIAYNPRTNECISDIEQYLRQFGINIKYQFFCHIDTRGKLWVYKGRDIWVLDFKTRKKLHTVLPISSGDIVNITDNGRQAVIVARNSIYTTNLNKGMRIWLNFYAKTMEPIYKYDTRTLLGTNGMLWIASNLKLMRYDPHSRQWHIHTDGKPDITCIAGLPNGLVCVSTTSTGLFVYDANGKLVDNVRQYAPLTDGLKNSHTEAVYYDRTTNSLLISYHKEGFSAIFPPEAASIQKFHIQSPANSYVTEDVISFASDKGDILAGTEDNGVYRLAQDGTITGNEYRGRTATAIMCGKDGTIWTGLYHGGLVGSNGKKFFPGQSPYKIIETAKGRFFVLLNGDGIWTLDPKSGKTRNIPTDNPWIMDMAYYKGKVYAASPKYLYIIDAKTLAAKTIGAQRFSTGFSNGNKALAIDLRGWVWLVNYKSETPADIYDTKTGRIFQVGGLNRYTVSAIEEDSYGNMWATTDKGLVKVTVRGTRKPEFSITLYNNSSFFNDRALLRFGNGLMAAGTSDGYVLFQPDRLITGNSMESSCPLILASLHVNGNDILPGEKYDGDILASSDLPYLRLLNLSHSENSIILEFLPKGIEKEGKDTWEYSIKGVTDGFTPLINGNITLTNLPSGTYDVMLRMSDDSWSGHEYKVLTIHVDRPLWLSWWAIALYAAAIVALGIFIHHYQLRRVQLNFFKKVSHDLRTPLTLVIAPIEELLNRVNDNDERKVLETIYRNARYLMRLINQILDYRRIEPSAAPGMSLETTQFPAQEHHDKTILIVDDNTDILSFLAGALGREYTVCQATDGNIALQVLRTTDVDIIVSDVTMAGMDGLELCRRVRGDINTSHIPIILLTARAMDDDQLRGLQVGADDYVTKPFNIDILRQRIRNILRRTEAAHEHFSKDMEVNPSEITVTTLDEEFIAKAIKTVEDNMTNPGYTVERLAADLGMSRTSLFKKLQAITGKSPLQFIRTLRMKRARQLMSRGGVLVSQVAYEVGYNSPKLFSRHFKEEFGIYPSEMLKESGE